MAKGKIPKGLLEWRKKQKKGAIMNPITFNKIKESDKKEYGSDESGNNVAGKVYWDMARKKYSKMQKTTHKKRG